MRTGLKIAGAGLLYLLTVAAQSGPTGVTRDAATGQALFEGKGGCLTCHAIDNRGGILGPDLSWIGVLRTPDSLRRALTDPDAQISRNYFTLVVETKDGQTIDGLVLNEDDLSIQIRDTRGELRSFLKSNLKDLRREARSLMPSYASKLSAVEIDHLVAYLRTLRTMWPVEAGERTRSIAPASENVAFFNRPERDAQERPDELVQALEIPEGATVADIGSGTGYFTWRLAQQVGPKGKVIAVDIQKPMLDLTAAAVKQRKLRNVEYVLARDSDPGLSENVLDMAFIAYAYHEFSEPEAFMAALRRALKPDGRLLILEYAKESNLAPAATLHRMSFEEIRREIEPMGFVIDRLLDFLPMQHGVIFIKQPPPPGDGLRR
jgi:putative heme-binding domain-containing protein